MTAIEQAKTKSLEKILNGLPFVMTPKEARGIIGVGHNKIYELLNSGQLKATRVKRRWLISKFDLVEFVCKGGQE